MQNAYSDALDTLLRDLCPPTRVRQIDGGAPAADLWQALWGSGFADCLLPEDAGGAALPLRDLAAVLHVLGAHAVPLPLGQTIAARAVLHAAGAALPDMPIALADIDGDAASTLVADGAHAGAFLVQQGDRCVLLDRETAQAEPTGAHADATVRLRRVQAGDGHGISLPPGTLRRLSACVHAAQLAGAMERVLELTLQYANDRQQFGRAIGKFQAIQQQISEMAEHVAAARMAAQIACDADGMLPDPVLVAIGKLRASDAVTPVAAVAHAVHGAIGITEEYDLQLYTRRLHAWRIAGGSEQWWARWLGRAVCDRADGGADGGAVACVRSWCEQVDDPPHESAG